MKSIFFQIHITPLENLTKYNKYKTLYSPEKPKLNFKPSPLQEIIAAEPDESPPELFNRALKRKFTELEEITQRLKQRLSTITNDDSDISDDFADDFADEFERDLNTECIETEKISFESILNNIPENLRPKELCFAGNASMFTKGTELKIDTEASEKEKSRNFNDLLSNITQKVKQKDDLSENTNMDTQELSSASSDTDFKGKSKNFDDVLKTISKDIDHENVDTDTKELGHDNFNVDLTQEKSRIDSLLEKINSLTETPTEQRIDSLLEKLSLITDDTDKTSFSNRYVSGCSIDQEPSESNNNPLLKQLNLGGNLDPDLIFNPLLFQKLFSGSNETTPTSDDFRNVHSLKSLIDSNSSSSSVESISKTNTLRQAPEGGTSDK